MVSPKSSLKTKPIVKRFLCHREDDLYCYWCKDKEVFCVEGIEKFLGESPRFIEVTVSNRKFQGSKRTIIRKTDYAGYAIQNYFFIHWEFKKEAVLMEGAGRLLFSIFGGLASKKISVWYSIRPARKQLTH